MWSGGHQHRDPAGACWKCQISGSTTVLTECIESEPAVYQGTSGEGPFFTVIPLEGISVVTERERQKWIEAD